MAEDLVAIVEQLNPAECYRQLMEMAGTRSGALVTFTGLVRDFNEADPVSSLFIEHYPGMTEKALGDIIQQARQRWQLDACVIVHRVGKMLPAEPIVFVGVCAAHRGEAFSAGEFVMDFLKTRAPFWKKETRLNQQDGELASKWLDARQEDTERAARWQES